MTLRDRAASALDATITTLNISDLQEDKWASPKLRAAVAEWLDGKRRLPTSTVRVYIKYLEMVARR